MPEAFYNGEVEHEEEYDEMCKPIFQEFQSSIILDESQVKRTIDITTLKGNDYIEALLGEDNNNVEYVKPSKYEFNFGKTYDFSEAERQRFPKFEYHKLDEQTIKKVQHLRDVYNEKLNSGQFFDVDNMSVDFDDFELQGLGDLAEGELVSVLADSEMDPEDLELEKRLERLTNPDLQTELDLDESLEALETSVEKEYSNPLRSEQKYSVFQEALQPSTDEKYLPKEIEEVKKEKKRSTIRRVIRAIVMLDCIRASKVKVYEMEEVSPMEEFVAAQKNDSTGVFKARRNLRSEVTRNWEKDGEELKKEFANGRDSGVKDVFKANRNLRKDMVSAGFRISEEM